MRLLKRFTLDRRTVLRGMLGGASVAIGLPMLEAMMNSHGTALAGGEAFPRRFVMWFFGNGVILDRWTPSAQGTGWECSEELAPLSDVQSYVSVLSGFNNRTQGRRGHHDGQAGMCSGIPFIEIEAQGGAPYASKFGGPSIDQVIVNNLQNPTLIPSLELGVSKRNLHGEGPTLETISHKSSDQPQLPELNPQAVYNRLFGNFVPPDDPSILLRQRSLDVVRGDIARLQNKVSAADRIRLEKHLDGIAQLENEIAATPPSCVQPDLPGETNTDIDGQEQLESVNRAMSDLLVYAFQCDLTRVCTYQWSAGVSQAIYWMLGHGTEQHGLSHEENGQQLVHETVVFEMSQLAYLLGRMRDTEEGGDGNMLDSSCVLVGSDVAEGMSHSGNDHPVLVCGRAGGALGPSTHFRSEGGNLSDVLLTCARTMVPGLPEIGADEGYSSQTVAAIEAG